MKKKTFQIVSVTVIFVVLVSIFVVFQAFMKNNSTSTVPAVDYSDTYATVSTLFQRKTFLYNGTYWLFYSNGTNLFYRTSTDGSNWRTPTTIEPGLSSSAMSVWLKDGKVQFTTTGGSNAPVTYRVGQIIGNEISWENEQNVVPPTPNIEYYNAYSTVDSEGHPWVSVIRTENNFPNASWNTVQVSRADSSDTKLWSPLMQITDNAITEARPCLVSLPDAQMYVVYVSQNSVEGRLWTGTDWQAPERITARQPTYNFAYSTVSLNGEVHLTFVENSTNNVYHYVRLASGEWQETLVSAAHDSVASILSVDSSKNTLYCLWIDENMLHVKKMENNVWSDVTIQSPSLTSATALSSFYEVSDGKLGVALLENLSPNPPLYRLRYFVIPNL